MLVLYEPVNIINITEENNSLASIKMSLCMIFGMKKLNILAYLHNFRSLSMNLDFQVHVVVKPVVHDDVPLSVVCVEFNEVSWIEVKDSVREAGYLDLAMKALV